MKTAAVPDWETIAADATRRRLALLETVRTWAARLHVQTRIRHTPTRIVATLDGLGRPPRTLILRRDQDATDRDRAEAEAGDLWDAAAQCWTLVRTNAGQSTPPLEHVVAELAEVGRWLAEFPVLIARHDREIDRLFQS